MIPDTAPARSQRLWRLNLALVMLCSLLPFPARQPAGPTDLAARLATLQFPDSLVVNSPAALVFDLADTLARSSGALSRFSQFLEEPGWLPAAQVIDRVARDNSINPRLLLALLEYSCRCVSGQADEALKNGYPLGVKDYRRKGLYGQLWWASNQLSAGYYGWREGWLIQLTLPDGSAYRPDPASNPGSVALQYYFIQLALAGWPEDGWEALFDPQTGFQAVFRSLFGDPLELARNFEPNLPAGLDQPELILPFEMNAVWSLTSGPHRAWEVIGSLAALDFAPAAGKSGCIESQAWVVAMADGIVVRSDNGVVLLDLDDTVQNGRTIQGRSDGLEQTGWAILYVHIAAKDRTPAGVYLHRGERIGHPSCEGGPATGVNLHVARKYNGEWIAAGGRIPLVMSGWKAHAGSQPYKGWLSRGDDKVLANIYGTRASRIVRTPQEKRPHGRPQE